MANDKIKKEPFLVWEYNGNLYRTKEKRDKAIEKDVFYDMREELVRVLADSSSAVAFDRSMTPKHFAAQLLLHWDVIKENVEVILTETDEE